MESFARLGIDWRIMLIYAVNFGLIIWLVARYLTKPLLKVLDERRSTIRGNLQQAETLKDELAHQKQTMEEEKKKMQATLQKELSDSRKTLAQKEKEADAVIDGKKAKMLEEIQSAIQAEKNNLVQNTQNDILKMVEKMVHYVVSNQVPQEVVKQSVNEAWAKYSGQTI